MNKVFILLLLTSTLFYSCTEVKTERYPNGKIKSEITLKNGIENGPVYYYHEKYPQVQMSYTMKDGKKEGLFEKYYFDGKIEYRAFYVNDVIHGEETMFERDGGIVFQAHYNMGKKEGSYATYHAKGMLKEKGNYVNDLWDGEWEYYDERGVLIGEALFNQGNGTLYAYNGNGNLYLSTEYAHNKKNGKEISFSDHGDTTKVVVFKEDIIIEIDGKVVER